VVTYIQTKEGIGPEAVGDILNKKSGFLGVSGVSSDCRDLHKAAEGGNERAQLTLDILVYEIKKFIGAYTAAMNGVDAILFTGGIGENDADVRGKICEGLSFLGVDYDEGLNAKASRGENVFTKQGSRVKAMVLPTNEEIMIARETLAVIR